MDDGLASDDSLSVLWQRASAWIAVEAKCTFDEAVALLHQAAEANKRTLDEIVAAVLSRTIRLGR